MAAEVRKRGLRRRDSPVGSRGFADADRCHAATFQYEPQITQVSRASRPSRYCGGYGTHSRGNRIQRWIFLHLSFLRTV
ncbi:hypothetical protein [Roseicella aerolata]|uniref:Uncharacterized protein n=1 Tax=Roseicella aerolata TaxID=2883479 RepID=A0A9X1LB78_9PROT|nr:hypothetical protein [Roseicella aerolata]MCB4825549.1 hypothetical protein [Roseicella aerolata]